MMTATPTSGWRWPLRLRRADEERTASGIYGTIVSAAVMASSHADSAGTVIAGVAVTLVVYWAAERYSRLVAERIHEDRKPTWPEFRRRLGTGWEMVTASALPLVVLAGFTAGGASLTSAVFAGLVCSTVLLCLAGWEIGHGTQLSFLERTVLVLIAGGFGGLMIALKALLH
jgi:TRAP-type C4-dicarboxylate transport system permease large subunit